MRDLAGRIWTLPWPPALRRRMEPVIMFPALQRLLVPRFLVGVAGVIENDRHEILFFRHTYREQHPWGLPTGFLEHGERPENALIREIGEEAGLRVELDGIWRVDVEPDRPLVTIAYRGRCTGGSFVPSNEVSDARFFPVDQLPPLIPGQEKLLERVLTQDVGERG